MASRKWYLRVDVWRGNVGLSYPLSVAQVVGSGRMQLKQGKPLLPWAEDVVGFTLSR